MSDVVLVDADDWAGLYIDGVLAEGVEQTHRLNPWTALEAVAKRGGLTFEVLELENLQGWLPDNLSEVER